MKDYSREVSMHCPVCGNDQFASLDVDFEDLCEAPDEVVIQCSDCKAKYTKRVLIEENQEATNANIVEMKNDIIKDIKKKIGKVFKIK